MYVRGGASAQVLDELLHRAGHLRFLILVFLAHDLVCGLESN